MENIVNKKLNLLKKERNKYENKRYKITRIKNEKIDKIDKQYRKDIKDIIDNISLVNKNINDIESDIRKYSTFKVSAIGKILELLMSIMEVEKYEIKKIETKGKKYEPTPFGIDEYEYDKYYTLITQPKLYEYNIFIDGMVKNSVNVVVLAEGEYGYKKNTTFCRLLNEKFIVDMDYGNFHYVKDFIESLVIYRYENNIENITELELFRFLKEFVEKNKDLIKNNYPIKEVDEKIERLTPEEVVEVKEKEERIIPNNNLIDRIGEVFDTQCKMAEFISPIEKKLKKLLENINYKFESDEGKVSVFLEKILYSTPTTFIGEISLGGIINYFHYLDGESIVNMNDKGLIFIYDLSNKLSSNLNELSNYERYIGTLDGQVFLIDNYIVCINSKNNFYSNEYNEYLNKQSNEEYDYGELLNSRIIQSEWLDDLCNTPNDELINFKVKTKRIRER